MSNNKKTKEQLLIEYLISSNDVFMKCKNIIQPEYFDIEHRKIVKFVLEYYDKYHALPDTTQIAVETGQKCEHTQLRYDQIQYCCDQLETHCKQQALFKAVMKSAELIEAEDYGSIETLIKDAITLSLDRDLGLDYFSDPLSRLEQLAIVPPKISTGWKEVDSAIGDGIGRTEMILFSANSGGGKSLALANLCLNFAHQGYDALYITLELPELMVAQRLDVMISGIPTAPRLIWEQNVETIATSIYNMKEEHEREGVKLGKIQIKRMPTGSTANQIKSYINEYILVNGKPPDLIALDYVDLMNPNEKISQESLFVKDKLATEQLRELGFEYNAVIATASQQNRDALKQSVTEHNQSIIAGGISKVNTTDVYISIVMDAAQQAAGVALFSFHKTRSGDGNGRVVEMKYEKARLRFLDSDNKESGLAVAVDSKIQKLSSGRGNSRTPNSKRKMTMEEVMQQLN